jgi:hypothetical protein
MMIGFIYTITEKSTGRRYVGQSIRLAKRWREHKARFPSAEFDYVVEQECCVGLLDTMEKYFIKKFDSVKSGFNMNSGGAFNRRTLPAITAESNKKRRFSGKGYYLNKTHNRYLVRIKKDKVTYGGWFTEESDAIAEVNRLKEML